MAAFQAEWFVAGGWAIDLYLGERTRDHVDVDIAIARDHQGLARRLLLLLERHGDKWVYRRDARVTMPWSLLSVTSPLGPVALAPEVALLFKAKEKRRRDQADFEAALPHLSRERRAWLMAALATAHPRHRWLRGSGQSS